MDQNLDHSYANKVGKNQFITDKHFTPTWPHYFQTSHAKDATFRAIRTPIYANIHQNQKFKIFSGPKKT